MAGWLSQLPDSTRSTSTISTTGTPTSCAMPKPPPPVIRGGKGGDYRTGRFPGGAKFKRDTPVVAPGNVDDYRVVYIYKDPVESMAAAMDGVTATTSRATAARARPAGPSSTPTRDSSRTVCGSSTTSTPTHLTGGGAQRNYPVVALNYHRLWDNLPAVMTALGLPQSLARTFPPRTESK